MVPVCEEVVDLVTEVHGLRLEVTRVGVRDLEVLKGLAVYHEIRLVLRVRTLNFG